MLLTVASVLIATLVATGAVRRYLQHRAILDHPNTRSSHAAPVPRGGGLAVVAVLVCAWAVTAQPAVQSEIWTVLAGAVFVAVLSWVDDLRSLSPLTRLIGQTVGMVPVLYWFAQADPVFQGLLPQPLDLALTALVWLWFVNLFNFMDGIDGISGIEAVGIGGGVALIAGLTPDSGLNPLLGLTMAAAALGFLSWNWPPAKIFLGDVGSVPLGFLLGWMLLTLASNGFWAAALILPAYYLADATITLLRRAARREKVWRAHREHFYQQAVQGGRSHAAVSSAIGISNVILIALAVLSLSQPWTAMAAAAVLVGALLRWLSR